MYYHYGISIFRNGYFFHSTPISWIRILQGRNLEFQVLVIKIQEYESESCQRVGRFESKCFH